MKSAGEAEARKEHRTLAILGGILAIGAISCTGVLAPEPIIWQVTGTEFWRGPLYRDPGESRHRVKGHVRIRVRTINGSQYGKLIAIVKEQRLILAAHGLDRVQSFALSSPRWPVPRVLTSNGAGGLNMKLDIVPGSLSPGDRIAVSDLSGVPILAGVLPDWYLAPHGIGPLRDDFGPGPGGETVRVRFADSTRTGDQLLEFRMAGLAPESAADLLLEDGGNGFVQVGSVTANRRGRAVLRWTSKGSDPLPLGAVTVATLEGKAFQVRVGAATVLEGSIP